MLSPQEVKPLLVHENRYVRRAAVEYFHGTCLRDVELLPLSLESRALYADDESLSVLSFGNTFAVNDESLVDVLETLASTVEGNWHFPLNRILVNAPIPLQLSHRSAILECPNVFPETIASIERRLELAQWSADRLWNELQGTSLNALATSSMLAISTMATQTV